MIENIFVKKIHLKKSSHAELSAIAVINDKNNFAPFVSVFA